MKQPLRKSVVYSLALLMAGMTGLSGVGGAEAALVGTGVACDGHGTGMTSQPGYVDCSGAWAGNNLNQSADVAAQISSDWGLTGLTSTDVTGGISDPSGTLNFANQVGQFVLSLKAGDAFSLYLFDGGQTGISSISFDTLGVGFFSGLNNEIEHFGQGLSHADVYASGSVPEPASLLLLGGGLAGLGIWRRKQV